MASSVAQICNLALLRCGITKQIAALTDSTTEARACKAAYEISKDAMLAFIPWSFATKRASLSLLTDIERTHWSYVYVLPSDFLAMQRITSPSFRRAGKDLHERWTLDVEPTLDVRVLLCDTTDAVIEYTCQPANAPACFPPLFVEALAWKLASELAFALPVKPQLGATFARGFEGALNRAAAHDLNSTSQDVLPDSEIITGR